MPDSSRNITNTTTSAVAPRSNPSIGMRLYSVVWWLSFAVFTVLLFILVLLAFPTVLFDKRRVCIHMMTCIWGWGVYNFNPFWSLHVEGRQHIPWDESALLVANHDSLADILVVGAVFRPFKFVSKASVFAVPVLGWGMRLNQYIELRRGNKESVLKMLAECRHWLNNDVPVMLFPEGTRSPDGMVKPFKDGAFTLAVETNRPIIPIVLAGTRDALPKHGLIAPLRSDVRVKVLEPVHPEKFQGNAEALKYHVRTVIKAEKARQTELLPKR